MRLVTWNLLHGVPILHRDQPQSDLRQSEQAGLSALQAAQLAPPDLLRGAMRHLLHEGPIDVLALQEVDRHQPRSGDVDQTALLAQEMGAHVARFAPSVRGTPGLPREGAAWVPASDSDDENGLITLMDGRASVARNVGPRYGVGLISAHPVVEWRMKRFAASPVSLPLLVPAEPRPRLMKVPDEPRTAIAARLETPQGMLTVATAHLSFVPGTNAVQLRQLRSWLAGLPRPLVLLGDFNLPRNLPATITGFESLARLPSYPVTGPRVQFDHVLGDGLTRTCVRKAQEGARTICLGVSDHAAVSVPLSL